MEPLKLNLSLSIPEINSIMAGLGNMPYVQVTELITSIRQQIEPQLQQQQQPAAN